MIFCMEMYMELQLYLPFLFTSDVSMVFFMFSRVNFMMKMQCPHMLNMNIIVMIFSSLKRWVPFMLFSIWREVLQDKENPLNLAF